MSARRIGISYRRFSDPKQSKGDSEDRQERDYRSFCQHHNLTPLTEHFIDHGRSGYKDEHRKKGRLGVLIQAAKDERFEPGTVIVVEAWDRLGRLRPDKQTDLIAKLLQTGVDIGVCRLNDIFTESDFGTPKWMMLAMFIQLAFEESRQKSERISALWKKRRQEGIHAGQLPAWLKWENDEMVPIPERVAAVKRIFSLSADEYGKARIVRKLVEEGHQPFGEVKVSEGRTRSQFSGKWTVAYIEKLLNDKRVLGHCQPRHTDDTPDGAVIEDHFPRVIEDDEFELARAGQEGRRKQKGTRDRKHVNVFQSLLVNALDGEGFHLHNRGGWDNRKTQLHLVNNAGVNGRGRTQTFPYLVFEEAILSQLSEVNPADVLPKPEAQKPSAVETLRAKLRNIRADIAQIQADLKGAYSKHLSAVLRDQEKEEEKIAGELQDELAKRVRPVERAWEGLPGLVDLIRKEGDEARLRLRPVLRAVVEEMRLLLVKRGARLIGAVQCFFTGGGVRSYLIVYTPACRNRDVGRWVDSLPSVADAEELDLRDREDAAALEEVLAEMDLAEFCTEERRF
jgi:DNA invertase Pin-like site-specific DNA recombinase